jgi:hypothetical protein
MSNNVKYEVKQIKDKLIGGLITGVCEDRTGESFGLTVKTKDGILRVWVDRDEEGNGPGHLDIQ